MGESGFSVIAVLLLSDSSSVTPFDPGTYGTWGASGLFIAALFVVGRAVYKRETGRADKLEDEVRRLNDLIRDRYVPALEASSEALRASERTTVEVLAELRAERRRRG